MLGHSSPAPCSAPGDSGDVHWDCMPSREGGVGMTVTGSHHHRPEVSLIKGCLAFGFAGVDYCLLSDHGCEYSCVNVDRSFACQCPEGHVLRSDGKTCASKCLKDKRDLHRCSVGAGVGALPTCICACVSCLQALLGPNECV